MRRLILVPQYPTKMRYQEWWWDEFPKAFEMWFDEIIVLGDFHIHIAKAPLNEDEFAPAEAAIRLEMAQMEQYQRLELLPNDVLLLNDLSFPGLFANMLIHKRPNKAYAICHATSKNNYDYFSGIRKIKYPIEQATAKLFDKVFVASKYHADKLKWRNVDVHPFPFPPFTGITTHKMVSMITVARSGVQKRNMATERYIEKTFGQIIHRIHTDNWDDYFFSIAKSKMMIITSREETYGYQVIDAVLNGCIPIAPNKFSYPELLPKEYLYSTPIELLEIINDVLSNRKPIPSIQSTAIRARNFYNHLAITMRHD